MGKRIFPTSWVRFLTGQACDPLQRSVPLTVKDFRARKSLPVVQPTDPYVLRVAVIGDPNAGKSTLVNKLSGWRVCSVSAKVHTTRENALAVFMEGNKQVIFVDTPGLITLQQGKRHHLEASLLTHPKESLAKSDLALILVDASNRWTRNHLAPHVLELLRENHPRVKTILVLNKIDTMRSRQVLLDLTRTLTGNTVRNRQVGEEKEKSNTPKTMEQLFQQTERKLEQQKEKQTMTDKGWINFRRVFSVSALTGEGVDDLRDYLLSSCKPGDWQHHPSMVTDQNPQELALMVVREKLLDNLPKEMPYLLRCVVEMWDVDPQMGSLKIAVAIVCLKQSVVSHIVGPRGKRVAAVVEAARQELANAFRCDVALKLLVKSPDQDQKN